MGTFASAMPAAAAATSSPVSSISISRVGGIADARRLACCTRTRSKRFPTPLGIARRRFRLYQRTPGAAHLVPGLRGQRVAALAALHVENRAQFLHRIVRKVQKPVEPGFQPWVGVDEVLHQIFVPRHDHHQIIPVVFHGLQNGIDGFLAEILSAFAA